MISAVTRSSKYPSQEPIGNQLLLDKASPVSEILEETHWWQQQLVVSAKMVTTSSL